MAFSKIKTYLRRILSCCDDKEDEREEWRPVIGEPYDFCHINGRSSDLTTTGQEQLRENTLPADLQHLAHDDNAAASGTPRLDRVRAHTRALSNSLKTATSNPMSTVGAKSAGYSSLPHGHSSANLESETNSPYEMTELLSHAESGAEMSKGSVETTWAGCEEDADSGRGGGRVG